MTNDLTKGKPWKLILMFMLPIFIGNVFQQLYNMVDTIIVGRTIGSAALAGVGSTGAVGFLIIGFAMGLTGGFSVMTSQCFGAKNEKDMRRSLGTSIILSAILSVVLTVVSVLAIRWLLRVMRTPEDILQYAYDYIIVICWGMGATVFYNLLSNIIRAMGDSVSPLIFLIIASVINVALDFWFIIGLKMGVAGAGLATVISQLLSGIMCLIYMFVKFPFLRLKREDFRTSRNWCWRHLVIGLPMAMQYSITAVGVMMQQMALNGLGTTVVTAFSAASKIDNFAMQILIALGTAMATFCGQNYGAGEYGRIKQGVKWAILYGLVSAVIFGILIGILARPLTAVFMKDVTEEILALSQKYLIFQGIFYPFLALIFIYRNALQGMGNSGITVLAGVIELAARAAASFGFVALWGFTGMCLSNPFAWVSAGMLLVIIYYLKIKKLKPRRADDRAN